MKISKTSLIPFIFPTEVSDHLYCKSIQTTYKNLKVLIKWILSKCNILSIYSLKVYVKKNKNKKFNPTKFTLKHIMASLHHQVCRFLWIGQCIIHSCQHLSFWPTCQNYLSFSLPMRPLYQNTKSGIKICFRWCIKSSDTCKISKKDIKNKVLLNNT